MDKRIVKRRTFNCSVNAQAFHDRLEITKSIELGPDGVTIVRFEPDQLEALDSTPPGVPTWCAEFRSGERYDIVSQGPFGFSVLDDSGRKADINRETMREARMPLDISPEFKLVKGVFK